MAATLDLATRPDLLIYADKGKSANGSDIVYALSFIDIPTLDTAYKLILDEGLATEQVYTVGSGLSLVEEENTVIWALDTAPLSVKNYSGYLVSDSNIDGIYLQINIKLNIK